MLKLTSAAMFVCLNAWVGIADAQYILILKNGRQITAQSYREEGTMIKFSGLGGEIAISKDQVQTIRRAAASDRVDTPSLALDRPPAAISQERPPLPTASGDFKSTTAPPSTDQQRAKKRAEEEKAYQDKVKELTEQLRELRDRYSLITRGNKGPEPSFFTTEEAFKGHQEDLLSRLRDAQNKAQGLPSGSAAASPPFSLDPPPAYSDKQRELSDLRSRINQIENDRQRLIEEMKAKNFETGSLFLD
jgi:hypothetical protein